MARSAIADLQCSEVIRVFSFDGVRVSDLGVGHHSRSRIGFCGWLVLGCLRHWAPGVGWLPLIEWLSSTAKLPQDNAMRSMWVIVPEFVLAVAITGTRQKVAARFVRFGFGAIHSLCFNSN
jgi:hypothetical protein